MHKLNVYLRSSSRNGGGYIQLFWVHTYRGGGEGLKKSKNMEFFKDPSNNLRIMIKIY